VVQCAARTNNHGLALDSGRRRVALAGTPGFAQRRELVDLLHRIGDQAGELAEGRALLDLLLEHAEFEKAIDLLLRLVASNNSNPDLVLQLAEVYSAIGDGHQAQRFYRFAIGLLQMENRLPEARLALDQRAVLAKDAPTIAVGRDLLEKGHAVDWDALRHSQSEDQRRRIAEEIGSGRVEREKKDGKKADRKADKGYEPSPVAKVETKPIAKEGSRPVVKSATSTIAKEETRAVVKSATSTIANETPRPPTRTITREEYQPEEKPKTAAIAKEETRAFVKPEPPTIAKAEPSAIAKEETKAFAKPEPTAIARQETAAFVKPEPPAPAKVEPKAGGKAERKGEKKKKGGDGTPIPATN
jgi:hypothetical protein